MDGNVKMDTSPEMRAKHPGQFFLMGDDPRLPPMPDKPTLVRVHKAELRRVRILTSAQAVKALAAFEEAQPASKAVDPDAITETEPAPAKPKLRAVPDPDVAPPAAEVVEAKPIGKMTKPDLIGFAADNDIDISNCKTAADMRHVIKLRMEALAVAAVDDAVESFAADVAVVPPSDFAPVPPAAPLPPAPQAPPVMDGTGDGTVSIALPSKLITFTEAELAVKTVDQLKDILAKHGVPSAVADEETLISMILTMQE